MSTTAEMVEQVLDMASDHGSRRWLRAPRVAANKCGGHDISTGEVTYRFTTDDTRVNLHIFTGGAAMLLSEDASVTQRLAHMLVVEVAERIR